MTPADTPPRLRAFVPLNLSAEERQQLGERNASVVVEALIDSTGHPVPCTIHVLPGGDLRLAAAAKSAVRAMEFSPATLNGVPTSAWIQQPFAVGLR